MARALFFAFLIISACSIIEDSDITSREELGNLVVKSIDITQKTLAGTSTNTGVVTTDEEANITVPNGVIKRIVWMRWPSLGNKKLKLKGGYTSEFRTYTSYLANGSPYTFSIYDKDTTTLLENYRFRYSSSGRLTDILTNVPFVDGGPATSRDTLIYNGTGQLISIVRRSTDASKAGTFTFMLDGVIDEFNFKSTYYVNSCQGNGCGAYYGGNYHCAPSNNGQPIGVMNLTHLQGDFLTIQDVNDGHVSCGGCVQAIDTFYFHPLMLVRDDLELGETLLFMYMVDWWQPAAAQSATSNEEITFKYKYDF